jgi:hypothetical protein
VTANNDITLIAGTGGMRIVSDVMAPAINLTSGLGHCVDRQRKNG